MGIRSPPPPPPPPPPTDSGTTASQYLSLGSILHRCVSFFHFYVSKLFCRFLWRCIPFYSLFCFCLIISSTFPWKLGPGSRLFVFPVVRCRSCSALSYRGTSLALEFRTAGMRVAILRMIFLQIYGDAVMGLLVYRQPYMYIVIHAHIL